MTEPKVVVACRIVPELKAQLEDEAAERGETLSSYMDLLINHRELIFEDTDTIESEVMEAAQEYIAKLENENTELKNGVDRLVSQVVITDQDLNDKPVQKETAPSLISKPYMGAILQNLEKLCQKHPDHSAEQLLLAASCLALDNGTFVVYNLKDYMKKHKQHFPPINNKEVTQ